MTLTYVNNCREFCLHFRHFFEEGEGETERVEGGGGGLGGKEGTE